jgi:hypothetical protein
LTGDLYAASVTVGARIAIVHCVALAADSDGEAVADQFVLLGSLQP